MPSSAKTPNLGLNSWAAQDKPKRNDFVEDNTIIDTALGGHINNSSVHLSTQDREKLNSHIYKTSYSGTGASYRNVALPFAPSCVIVYKRYAPLCAYDAAISANVVNSALISQGENADDCGYINGNSLVVYQANKNEDGIAYNLNEQYGQYVIIAFR